MEPRWMGAGDGTSVSQTSRAGKRGGSGEGSGDPIPGISRIRVRLVRREAKGVENRSDQSMGRVCSAGPRWDSARASIDRVYNRHGLDIRNRLAKSRA